MPKAERLSEKMNSRPRSEIFQPKAFDIPASRKGVYLFYNSPNNFSRRTHVDRSCMFRGFFRVSR